MKYHVIKNRDGELGAGKLIKQLAYGTLLDDKIEEDPTTFSMRDPDDISEKISFLDTELEAKLDIKIVNQNIINKLNSLSKN
jgi:hypothetical protein